MDQEQIEAEAVPEVSESFDVESVPHFVLLRVRLSFLYIHPLATKLMFGYRATL